MTGSNPGLLLHPGCHSAASWPSHSGSWAAGVGSWSFSANTESSISAACPSGSASASLHPGPSHHGASAHPSSTSAHAYIRLRPSTATVLPASMFHRAATTSHNSVYIQIWFSWFLSLYNLLWFAFVVILLTNFLYKCINYPRIRFWNLA